jgi:hypothetical protein
MYNNVKHIPFKPTLRAKQIEHVLKASPGVLRDLEGKISEFQYSDKDGWILYKERPEKLSANSYLGAESIYAYLQSPITPQQLYEGGKGYFNVESGEQYKSMRAYMNAVKALFINKYMPKRSVLDLGIGRGQDIKKYTFAGVNRVIGLDADINAL